ncbi:hypothetical protein [Halomarina litorea]|uniref:hypothetical protein n=1 Tax=Halomarina litorea TaxID=2961595 RepID=UPI0020C3A482|nr:hypothetical protein [Halomarina sp. BCD28]
MKAMVHFAVGVAGALFVLAAVGVDERRSFLATFASGFWALLPDGWWVAYELGLVSVSLGHAVHGSVLANVFWFHQVLDANEGPEARLELAVALSLLVVAVVVYYTVNDWSPHDRG